jgi:hypothetical protein
MYHIFDSNTFNKGTKSDLLFRGINESSLKEYGSSKELKDLVGIKRLISFPTSLIVYKMRLP